MSEVPGNSFNDIYTSYYKKSFFFAKSYVHNDLAAEDIASEALIKLWEKLKAEPVEAKYILPLLLTILKNKACCLLYTSFTDVRNVSPLMGFTSK